MSTHRILIAGGYGVFGSLLARELLAALPIRVVIAGRDLRSADRLCRRLGERAEPLKLDLRDPAAVERATRDCEAIVCCAGPLQDLDRELPGRVAGTGVHWLDISDGREWVLALLGDERTDRRARHAGAAVIPGLSTSPTLSTVLVMRCLARLPTASWARVTLFIGNRNPKGAGVIASALESGEPGPGLAETPFGLRPFYRVRTADARLWESELRLTGEFRVATEWDPGRLVTGAVHGLTAVLGRSARHRLARALGLLARPLARFGSDLGALAAEVWSDTADRVGVTLKGRGQRMAVLPSVVVLRDLLGGGEIEERGVLRAYNVLPVDRWLDRLVEAGLECVEDGPDDHEGIRSAGS